MKKGYLIFIFMLLLASLFGCSISRDKFPIKDGNYAGPIFPDPRPTDPNNYNFPYENASCIIVIQTISKDEFDASGGINVLQDQSRIRRSNYYYIELKVIFSDDKDSFYLPLYFTGMMPHTRATIYIHEFGELSINSDHIAMYYNDIHSALKLV